jgi:hypothetical protein
MTSTTPTPRKKSVNISRKPAIAEAVSDDSASQHQPVITTDTSLVADQEKARNLIGKAVYSSVYFASYGIVFGALVVSSFIPGRNFLGKAINDGSAAARKSFENTSVDTKKSATASEPTLAA